MTMHGWLRWWWRWMLDDGLWLLDDHRWLKDDRWQTTSDWWLMIVDGLLMMMMMMITLVTLMVIGDGGATPRVFFFSFISITPPLSFLPRLLCMCRVLDHVWFSVLLLSLLLLFIWNIKLQKEKFINATTQFSLPPPSVWSLIGYHHHLPTNKILTIFLIKKNKLSFQVMGGIFFFF